MKNKEALRAMTDEELANFLCNLVEIVADKADKSVCDFCPVADMCERGKNGFIPWLESEEKIF